jgi:hypothetical protein
MICVEKYIIVDLAFLSSDSIYSAAVLKMREWCLYSEFTGAPGRSRV